MNYLVKAATWQADQEQLLSVRFNVFVEEQSIPAEIECDDKDETAYHWLAVDEHGTAIGTARMLPDGRIGRLAVIRAYRGNNIGKLLLNTIVNFAQQHTFFETFLDSQITAIDFYRNNGFEIKGEEFLISEIPHIRMTKQLMQTRMLGIHGGDFAVHDMASTVAGLISQASRKIRILSYDLDHSVFDNDTVSEKISALARKSRYCEIRLLVLNTSDMIKRGHRLLNLSRRLSSSIALRTINGDINDIKSNLIIADELGVICQSTRDKQKVWANFNNRPVATNHANQFDELWSRSVEDRNTRLLSL